MVNRMSEWNESRWKLGEDLDGPVLAGFVAFEAIFSASLNLYILIYTLVYGREYSVKNSTLLLLCLSLSNLLMAILYMPFVVIAAATGEWIFGCTNSTRENFCQFHGFLFIFSISTSSHILALISVDRFVSIVKPRAYQKYMTWKTVTGIIIIIGVSYLHCM